MFDRIHRDGKSAQLSKWGDSDADFLMELNDDSNEPFGKNNHHDPDDAHVFRDQVKSMEGLKISDPPKKALRPAFSQGKSPHLRDTPGRATLLPRVFTDYADKDGDVSFGEEFEISAKDQAKMNEWVLPATISLPSPGNRRSLSSYSEDTDTDITEIDEDDFEEIDDIFGKEESGIYKSSKGKAGDVLSQRKQQLQKEAELEDMELYKKYQNQEHTLREKTEDVQTLKLRDLTEMDQTVDYEYTKDDFESIEDGFIGDPSQKIHASKLSQFRTPSTGLKHKMSMPTFPQSLRTSNASKSKSSMDLNGILKSPSEHPFFNNNNKLIRKLDRMPSFHTENRNRGEREREEREKEEREREERDPILDMDYNMELHKKQLLEKYMEITEKQMQLRSSPKKKKRPEKSRKNIGLVKFLNDQSYAPAVTNRKMRFNASAKTWEGNDHDLLRFEELPRKQPGLITSDQFSLRRLKGNMQYDADNLRWVNMDPLDEESENVFEDVTDLVPNDIPQYARGLKTKPSVLGRGVSTFTQRTTLTSLSNSARAAEYAGEEFHLNRKLLAKFEKEEDKIRKKTHNWFGAGEVYHLSLIGFDPDYFWDIRKMVMDGHDESDV